ncbi:YdcF family protein [Paenibacillus flagellatus]|uniref:YdcF family protein n=1 Tax=Paenibacillus flagellatus TaxID=2211139 RepID=A0A2V5K178_9BACL|nr:YdcF family protein [Paenibacillus flagellatus]PYI52965.1 YdcF family protein [Paenibacillus flagellatus]
MNGRLTIPKQPDPPDLTLEQMERMTEIVFHPACEPAPCDAIFVLGGTHPGHWEKTIQAYRLGLADTVLVTGGVSPTAVRHPDWPDAGKPESRLIAEKLIEAGVPERAIAIEDRSRHSLENALYARDTFDFGRIASLLVVCKSHAAGRQIRTLMRHLPPGIRYVPYGFDAVYGDARVGRDNWMNTDTGRARVYGEYLRICRYGDRGHLERLEAKIDGLPEG